MESPQRWLYQPSLFLDKRLYVREKCDFQGDYRTIVHASFLVPLVVAGHFEGLCDINTWFFPAR